MPMFIVERTEPDFPLYSYTHTDYIGKIAYSIDHATFHITPFRLTQNVDIDGDSGGMSLENQWTYVLRGGTFTLDLEDAKRRLKELLVQRITTNINWIEQITKDYN